MAFAFARRRTLSLLGLQMRLPTETGLDRQLMGGSLLFGIGWGIAGLCPGPAIAALALSPVAVLPFVVAMLAGMALHRAWPERRHLSQSRSVS